MDVMNFWQRYLLECMALINPPDCPGCHRITNSSALPICCYGCKPKMGNIPRCTRCGRFLNNSIPYSVNQCNYCKKEHYETDAIFCIGLFEKEWQSSVVGFKCAPDYFFSKQLVRMATVLIKRYLNMDKSFNIMAVPARNKSELHPISSIAKKVSGLVMQEYREPLHYIRKTKKQHLLKQRERVINMQASMVLKRSESVTNQQFIVIDDVITTGATINECARVLKQNGAEKVVGLALARSKTPND